MVTLQSILHFFALLWWILEAIPTEQGTNIENQRCRMTGYCELTAKEIDLINRLKVKVIRLMELEREPVEPAQSTPNLLNNIATFDEQEELKPCITRRSAPAGAVPVD